MQLGVSLLLGMQLGVTSVLWMHWMQGTQKRRRLSLDATPVHLTQGLFLLMNMGLDIVHKSISGPNYPDRGGSGLLE